MSALGYQLVGAGLLCVGAYSAAFAGYLDAQRKPFTLFALLAIVATSTGGGLITKGGEKRGVYLTIKEVDRLVDERLRASRHPGALPREGDSRPNTKPPSKPREES